MPEQVGINFDELLEGLSSATSGENLDTIDRILASVQADYLVRALERLDPAERSSSIPGCAAN